MTFTVRSSTATLRQHEGLQSVLGYLAFVILITAWWTRAIGPAALIVLSLLVTAFVLFQAPVWCCAINRDGTLCRDNSSGLLLGCSKRQHKWQKLKMTFVSHAWRQMNRGLWASPREALTTVGAIVAVLSAAVATAVEIKEEVPRLPCHPCPQRGGHVLAARRINRVAAAAGLACRCLPRRCPSSPRD
jgi:hypothetical protein